MQAQLTLHKTYYNQGFWNIPVDLDRYVRKDEGPTTLLLGKSHRKIQAHVNRSANQNGTARIMGKSALRDWFQQNYAVMDSVPLRFISPTLIVMGRAGIDKWDNPLNKWTLKAKVTEQGVIIPKWLLSDVDEVLIRRRNGVIEVAPVDENGHRARGESKGTVASGRQKTNDDNHRRQPRGKPLPKDSANDSGSHEKSVVQTHLTLWKSYYASGNFTVPVYFDEYVRPDEGTMTLALDRGKREIQAYVNRSETLHGNARILGGASLRDWFQENYRIEEKFHVSFDSPSKITLGGPMIAPSMEETDTIWDLGKDPIPAEELDIRDASVNLDKYIYGE